MLNRQTIKRARKIARLYGDGYEQTARVFGLPTEKAKKPPNPLVRAANEAAKIERSPSGDVAACRYMLDALLRAKRTD